ncbi:MAG: diguanylate cyclase [Janthinobacterium lividum]
MLPFVMIGLGLVLTSLTAWAILQLQHSADDAAQAKLFQAVQQQDTEANSQNMAATNALMAQSSDRFQELFQGLPAACVCFDKDGRIMEWNRAFEQLYALPAIWSESIWETLYVPADNPELVDAIAAVFDGARQEGIEWTYRRPDGSCINLYCSIFPLRGLDGEITGAISADIDISPQHRAEDALRRSEERMHTLYNVTSQQGLSFEEKTSELLTLGAAQFGLDIGILAQVVGSSYQIIQAISPDSTIVPGAALPVCDTYCAEALKMADTVSFEEAGATGRSESTAYHTFGLEAYLGTPVRINGAIWGTLCFAGRQPHPHLFTSGDRELMRLMAQWIGGEVVRRQAEDAIRESEERFRIAIASMSEALIVVDAAGLVTLWNDSAEQILMRTRTEMYGLRPLNPEFEGIREDGTKFPQGSYPLIASLRRGEPQSDVVMGLPRGSREISQIGQSEMLWVSVNAKPLFRSGASAPYAVVATFTDITERRRSTDQITRQMVQITEYAAVLEQQKDQLEAVNHQLETLALHDSLTGLGNRRAFEKRITQEVGQARRYGTPLSLLLMDVDSFKSYNDSFGHPAGDEVLRLLADVVRNQGRETDFFARYGGEEFIIILPQTDAAGAMVLAERLRTAVEKAAWPQRSMTASLGAATLLPSMPDAAEFVSAADQALYAAKASGRNCISHALTLPGIVIASEDPSSEDAVLSSV